MVVKVALPTTAATLDWRFGVVPAAYADTSVGTGGMVLGVDLEGADGETFTSERVSLEPSRLVVNRRSPEIQIRLPRRKSGKLLLSTLTGAHHNTAYDWAYWSKVVLHPSE